MATPTIALNFKNLILREVGESATGQNDGPVASVIDALWDMWADKAYAPRLQYYYTLKEAIEIALGEVVAGTPVERGVQNVPVDSEKQISTLNKKRDATLEAITKIEMQYAAVRPGAVGTLTHTSPRTVADVYARPTDSRLDPNDPRFRGDPIRGSFRRFGGF